MTTSAVKVMIFTEAYLPGFRAGGPIQSVANIVAALNGEFELSVVTSSWDLGAEGPYPGIEEGRWVQRDGARVMYVPRGPLGLAKLTRVLLSERPDVLYLNGLFHPRFSLWPLMLAQLTRASRRLVVSPRGMLGPGALEIKRFKKAAFLGLAWRAGLYRGVDWHATSELEAEEVRGYAGRSGRVSVAPNLVARDRGADGGRIPKKQGEARFFFLSRISEKKNLEFLFDVLGDLPARPGVTLSIVGPADDPRYLEALQARVPESWRPHVRFVGPVPHHGVAGVIRQQHFLLLPTRHENFGHAIVESLVYGCPVVISQETPWRGLASEGVGWDLPLDRASWVAVLQRCIEMQQRVYEKMSVAAAGYGSRIAEDPETLEATRRLFRPGEGARI